MRLWFVILFGLMPSLPLADERAALYGTWGDPQQCAQQVIIPGGSKRAAPFQISDGWLRHGQMWCRLSWFPVQTRDTGLFAPARALCGEDSARPYRLDIVLDGPQLRLIWDEGLINGPLGRCAD